MGVVKLSTAGILDYQKYSNFLAGNEPVSLGSYDLLETEILTSSQNGVTFSSLGSYSNYQHLQIRAVARSNNLYTYEEMGMRLNSDSGSNYARHKLRGNGSSVSSSANTGQNRMEVGAMLGGNASSDDFGVTVIDILDPFETTKNTTIRALSGRVTSGDTQIDLGSGFWNNTNAVTTIELFHAVSGASGWVSGSRFSLYGLKGA